MIFTVVFDNTLIGFAFTDFILTTNGSATGKIKSINISSDNSLRYEIAVVDLDGEGDIFLEVTARKQNKSGEISSFPLKILLHHVDTIPPVPAFKIQDITIDSHSCVLASGGVRCWGRNRYGELGRGVRSERTTEAKNVMGLEDGVTAIAIGSGFSCAIQRGELMCWGRNSYGTLGFMYPNHSSIPRRITALGDDVFAVAAYYRHACAIRGEGTLFCWGSNGNGRLGLPLSTKIQPSSIQVPGLLQGVTAVAVGGRYTCAVQNGVPKCWGDNTSFQLGNTLGDTVPTPTNVAGLESGVTAIAAGFAHACAIHNGGLKCWGRGKLKQLGLGDTENRPMPTLVPGLESGVSVVSLSDSHSCAVHNSAAKCWGKNTIGRLGINRRDRQLEDVSEVFGLGRGVTDIVAQASNSCAVHKGVLKCWGYGYFGQLGNGRFDNQYAPVESILTAIEPRPNTAANANTVFFNVWFNESVIGLDAGDFVVATASGNFLGEVVRITGEDAVYTVEVGGVIGDGDVRLDLLGGGYQDLFGNLGRSFTRGKSISIDTVVPRVLSANFSGSDGADADAIVITVHFSEAIRINRDSFIVHGSETVAAEPTSWSTGYKSLHTIRLGNIRGVGDLSLEIVDQGYIDMAGNKGFGFVGQNVHSVDKVARVLAVTSPPNSSSLSVVRFDVVFDGPVYGLDRADFVLTVEEGVTASINSLSGDNGRYQINVTGISGEGNLYLGVAGGGYHDGQGHLGQEFIPGTLHRVDTIPPAPQLRLNNIGIGYAHACVTHNGIVRCWGNNQNGQLGDGTSRNRKTPARVLSLNGDVSSVAVGKVSTCAIHGGAVKCWGSNKFHQLGNSGVLASSMPLTVSGLENSVTTIAMGIEHACAIQRGAAKCWGANSYGQIGNDTTIRVEEPILLTDLDGGVSAIAVGNAHSCAVHQGTAKCWGRNHRGQLGHGITSRLELVSTPVFGLNNGVSAIATGADHTCAVQNNAVKCWGFNGDGQTGGTTGISIMPVTVPNLGAGVTSIAAGATFSCAKHYARVKCWGRVLGSVSPSPEPLPIAGLSVKVRGLVAASGQACAIDNRLVRCWGEFEQGLGDGTSFSSFVPVTVYLYALAPRYGTAMNSKTAVFDIVFREPVTGLDLSDFVLTPVDSLLMAGGNSPTGMLSSISGSGTVYEVNVSNLNGSGELRLDVSAHRDYRDRVGNKGLAFQRGIPHQVDLLTPTVNSVQPRLGQPSNATSIIFELVFSEPVDVSTDVFVLTF